MTLISLIAAIDEAYGLGLNNQLLAHLPADLHHFKQTTMGKPVIMGRKTYQSIGKALPGRINIVLTHDPLLIIEDVIVVNSLKEALHKVGDVPEVMIIGGADIFSQAFNIADRIYLTKIHHKFVADTYFPQIDPTIWQEISCSTHIHDEKNKYDMSFHSYVRRS